jgi:hypothetical protein
MPSFSDPQLTPTLRVLLLGHSGTGKTGGLASLVKAGYHLHLADFDNGWEILYNLLKDDKAALARVNYEVFRDQYSPDGNSTVPKDSVAWGESLKWMDGILNKDPGPDTILAVDSLSFAARAAMNYTLKLNGRLKSRPWPADWGDAQGLIVNLVGMLADHTIRCHIICSAHIEKTGGQKVEMIGKGEEARKIVIDEGPVRQLPAMIGKAINPVIPRFFNHMLQFHRVGSGAASQYQIHTRPHEDIELKSAAPGIVKPVYPLATGLADYFQTVRGTSPKG